MRKREFVKELIVIVRNLPITGEIVENNEFLMGGWNVSLAKKHSILVLIQVKEFLTEFLPQRDRGKWEIVRNLLDWLRWRRFALSVLLWCVSKTSLFMSFNNSMGHQLLLVRFGKQRVLNKLVANVYNFYPPRVKPVITLPCKMCKSYSNSHPVNSKKRFWLEDIML